jgi:4-hydroxy 2-oxovalerate aldolase
MDIYKNMKILDCTLRDGGYYTNWDFDQSLVSTYIDVCNNLPVDYLEIGYRSKKMKDYHGEFFYLPISVIKRLKSQTNKKLVVIVNEKDNSANKISDLLMPCRGLIDMIRLAIDPENFERALDLAKEIKKMGFEVGFNVMYMSNWKNQKSFLELLPKVNGLADVFYMVDSYGGIFPSDVRDIIQLLRSYIPNIPLGFHGHNNLELALINSLTALNEGCVFIDSTVTGMGRGAGNLKTELLLTTLNSMGKIEVDFNSLTKIVEPFLELQKKYEWGTNLPYMVSGANSLPQKDVMDWVGKRFYSFNSIIRALNNRVIGVEDNISMDKWDVKNFLTEKVLIVGGGSSVKKNISAIHEFLKSDENIVIIHASSKNALHFSGFNNKQFFCLVGNEGYRMEEVFKSELPLDSYCILPPSPRKMGTYVPEKLINKSYELEENSFTELYVDSHTAIALQISINLNSKFIYLVGYDGYSVNELDNKSKDLFDENSYLFNKFKEYYNCDLVSLLQTSYPLSKISIFSII